MMARQIAQRMREADLQPAMNVVASMIATAALGAFVLGGALAIIRAELVLVLSFAALTIGGAKAEDIPARMVQRAGWLAIGAAVLALAATFVGAISFAAALLPLVMAASGIRAAAVWEEEPETRRWHLGATAASVVWLLLPYGQVARWASVALATAVGMSLRSSTDDRYSHDVVSVREAGRSLRTERPIGRGTILTLAAGVAAAVFTFVAITTSLLRPLPYATANRLVVLQETRNDEPRPLSFSEYADYRAQTHTMGPLAAFAVRSLSFAGGGSGEAVQLRGAIVSQSVLTVLGARVLLGRAFAQSQDNPGAASEIDISYDLWMQRFGGDVRIVGRTVMLDDRPFTIVGVMPKDFHFPGGLVFGAADVWAPLGMLTAADRATRNRRSEVVALGSLPPGATIESARREMLTVSARLAAEHPASNAHVEVTVDDATDVLVGPIRTPLLLLGAVGLFVAAMLCGIVVARVIRRRRASGEDPALLAAKIALALVTVVVAGMLVRGSWTAFSSAAEHDSRGALTAFVSVA